MILEEKFWPKVEKTKTCWLWIASTRGKGYGAFGADGKNQYAHRASWEIHYGPIPDGLWVLHHCDTPACVNPQHLFLGTNADNMQDCVAKGRTATGERNGSKTHPERRPKGERHGTHTHPGSRPTGERNGRAKLTEVQVWEIRALYASGEYSQHAIASRFGVSRPQISAIVNFKNWPTSAGECKRVASDLRILAKYKKGKL